MSEIRRKTDWYYNAQLNSDNNILAAKAAGADVFDIVDTNVQLYQLAASYRYTQADGIIQVDSTSMGAYSVNVGTRLPSDYVPTHSNCTNPNHNHTDPEGLMDVRTGLLPDHTFYFSGQNHATTGSNDVIMSLIIALATDENFESVFTYPDKYPQFNYSRETLQLRKDVEEMRVYNRTSLSAEDARELDAAIAAVDSMLEVTIVDAAACKATADRFYAIYDKIMGNDGLLSDKNTSAMACTVIKGICDGLFEVYGDAAYSEMPMLTLNQILGM